MYHPWNSLLHNAVKSFLESELLSQRPSLVVDVVLNHNLPGFIAHSQKDSVGFLGQLRHCDLQGFLYLLVFISLCLISRIHNPYGMY